MHVLQLHWSFRCNLVFVLFFFQSRDYAKQMLMANYNEEFHDDYDIPVTFHAQVQLGFASRHDYEKREEERRKERAVRKQMQEKQEWKDM